MIFNKIEDIPNNPKVTIGLPYKIQGSYSIIVFNNCVYFVSCHKRLERYNIQTKEIITKEIP